VHHVTEISTWNLGQKDVFEIAMGPYVENVWGRDAEMLKDLEVSRCMGEGSGGGLGLADRFACLKRDLKRQTGTSVNPMSYGFRRPKEFVCQAPDRL
jgi:hypothetical protein